MGGTLGAALNVAARPTRGAVRRECKERRVSFFHSDDPAVAMGVPDCCGGGGGLQTKSFSVNFSTAVTVAMITMLVM